MKALINTEIVGNWATLLLATDDKGKLDFAKLSDEIDVLIASQPNGIYSNGTAGEFYAQTEDEFDRISLLLSEKCEKAEVPYQIGVSHMSPQISLERLRRIKDLEPGAVQVILPDWFPVTLDEAIDFLKKMEETANGISLVLYNPPHAKKNLQPADWTILKKNVQSLVGVKVFDQNADTAWFSEMKKSSKGLSVFIPGHRLITGLRNGAHGAYSNVACLNPFIAQHWYEMAGYDMESALEMEVRINRFMSELIAPFITQHGYPNHACDRFMALLGGWADVGSKLRWPYRSIPVDLVESVKMRAKKIIPEFFK
ncbi:dihydrodipicolinate synthase family protein [Maribellus sediminis]|uniref:dihydrodipicolinate synthase family protein n=1 Tax=Maribellus sediminis TaxID=2696285 RepID=UPI001430046F|nr:dihydrodipicolinate synthase family protein [Maribellus sediminis]